MLIFPVLVLLLLLTLLICVCVCVAILYWGYTMSVLSLLPLSVLFMLPLVTFSFVLLLCMVILCLVSVSGYAIYTYYVVVDGVPVVVHVTGSVGIADGIVVVVHGGITMQALLVDPYVIYNANILCCCILSVAVDVVVCYDIAAGIVVMYADVGFDGVTHVCTCFVYAADVGVVGLCVFIYIGVVVYVACVSLMLIFAVLLRGMLFVMICVFFEGVRTVMHVGSVCMTVAVVVVGVGGVVVDVDCVVIVSLLLLSTLSPPYVCACVCSACYYVTLLIVVSRSRYCVVVILIIVMSPLYMQISWWYDGDGTSRFGCAIVCVVHVVVVTVHVRVADVVDGVVTVVTYNYDVVAGVYVYHARYCGGCFVVCVAAAVVVNIYAACDVLLSSSLVLLRVYAVAVPSLSMTSSAWLSCVLLVRLRLLLLLLLLCLQLIALLSTLVGGAVDIDMRCVCVVVHADRVDIAVRRVTIRTSGMRTAVTLCWLLFTYPCYCRLRCCCVFRLLLC